MPNPSHETHLMYIPDQAIMEVLDVHKEEVTWNPIRCCKRAEPTRMIGCRWAGVPWIMKAGKALNERKVEIRVQYKSPASGIHPNLNEMRNELVVRGAHLHAPSRLHQNNVHHCHLCLTTVQTPVFFF